MDQRSVMAGDRRRDGVSCSMLLGRHSLSMRPVPVTTIAVEKGKVILSAAVRSRLQRNGTLRIRGEAERAAEALTS